MNDTLFADAFYYIALLNVADPCHARATMYSKDDSPHHLIIFLTPPLSTPQYDTPPPPPPPSPAAARPAIPATSLPHRRKNAAAAGAFGCRGRGSFRTAPGRPLRVRPAQLAA